jgi:hypothetical protein
MRNTESETIRRVRSEHAQEFALSEKIFEFGSSILLGRSVANPEGDAFLGFVVIGLLVKILTVFWSLIVLTERALSASSLMRELTEAVISLAYLVREDSVERARLYWDHLAIREFKDLKSRLRDPGLQDWLTPEYREAVDRRVQELSNRRGPEEFERMLHWPTWAGAFPLEEMARRAGVPDTIYNLAYRFESRAPHGLDISAYVTATPQGNLLPTLPATAERHLMPSAAMVLMALDLGARALQLGHEDRLEELLNEVLRVSGLVNEQRQD